MPAHLSSDTGDKTVLVRHLPFGLWQRVRATAAEEGVTLQQFVIDALELAVAELQKPAVTSDTPGYEPIP